MCLQAVNQVMFKTVSDNPVFIVWYLFYQYIVTTSEI